MARGKFGNFKEQTKAYGGWLNCMDCQKFLREEKLVPTPSGLKCENCLQGEDLKQE